MVLLVSSARVSLSGSWPPLPWVFHKAPPTLKRLAWSFAFSGAHNVQRKWGNNFLRHRSPGGSPHFAVGGFAGPLSADSQAGMAER